MDPQTPPEKAFGGPKQLFTKYLEDFGRLGHGVFQAFVALEIFLLLLP